MCGAIAAKLKVVIADDEQLICSMLAKLINWDELGLMLTGHAYDGGELLSLIESEQPDIVITDICMPLMDGLDVIRLAKQRGYPCRFVVISGYRQFDYAYNALKYDVADYLLKPIDAKELNSALEKISEDLRANGASSQDNTGMLRSFFMKKAFYDAETSDLSMESLNGTYSLNFRTGLFRFLLVKIDYTDDIKVIYDNLSSLQKKVEETMDRIFGPLCYDILYDRKTDRVEILLNYEREKDREIRQNMPALLLQVKNVTDLFSGLYVTVGIGDEYPELAGAICSRDEAQKAIWARMVLGFQKVIFFGETKDSSQSLYQDKMKKLAAEIRHSFETLNVTEFRRFTGELFALPKHILGGATAYESLKDLKNAFFDINEKLIDGFADVNILAKETAYELMMAYTMEKYASAFQEKFSGIMEDIMEHTHTQNARPIRQAVTYIEEHYKEHISLEIVANEVTLSPVYFSGMFKREVGQNFSEYVTDYRIRKAKDLLKRSNLSILEISDAVGFKDPKYFSKIFKKAAGITPAEYRKIYG